MEEVADMILGERGRMGVLWEMGGCEAEPSRGGHARL